MKIGILGTGMVGEALGTKLAQLGHQVKMGSRTANNESAAKWVKTAGASASQGTFTDAAGFGEIVFVCLKGEIALEVVRSVRGAEPDGSVRRCPLRFQDRPELNIDRSQTERRKVQTQGESFSAFEPAPNAPANSPS